MDYWLLYSSRSTTEIGTPRSLPWRVNGVEFEIYRTNPIFPAFVSLASQIGTPYLSGMTTERLQ
jgi:hypothetical protein